MNRQTKILALLSAGASNFSIGDKEKKLVTDKHKDMTNTNFRGYGGDASQTDNFDWYTPVEQEPLDYLGYPPSGGGGGYVDPIYAGNALYSPPNPSGGGYGYGGYGYGGDSMGGLNDALSAQIAEEIRRSLEAQIQAQIEADRKLQEAAEYFAIAENRRKLAEAIEAERLRILTDENERQRLSAADNERMRIAAAQLAADAERQRMNDEAEASRRRQYEAEQAAATALLAERQRMNDEAEASRKRQYEAEQAAAAALLAERQKMNQEAEASRKKQYEAEMEAERKRLAAIEAQKVADAEKLKRDLLVEGVNLAVETKKQVQAIVTPEQINTKLKVDNLLQPVKKDNTMLIGGILLALVGVYIITKKD